MKMKYSNEIGSMRIEIQKPHVFAAYQEESCVNEAIHSNMMEERPVVADPYIDVLLSLRSSSATAKKLPVEDPTTPVDRLEIWTNLDYTIALNTIVPCEPILDYFTNNHYISPSFLNCCSSFGSIDGGGSGVANTAGLGASRSFCDDATS